MYYFHLLGDLFECHVPDATNTSFWSSELLVFFFFFFFFHAENVCVCSMRHWGDIRTSLVIQKRFSRLFSGLVSVLDEDGKTLSVCVRALLDSLHRPQTLVVNCYTLALHDRNWRWPVHFTDETPWQILQGRVRLPTALLAVYGNLCSFVIRHVLSFLCSGYIAFLLFFFLPLLQIHLTSQNLVMLCTLRRSPYTRVNGGCVTLAGHFAQLLHFLKTRASVT